MATRTITCTHRDIRLAMDAASQLSQRKLKDLNTELRVGRLVKALREDFQDTETARERILSEHPVPADWDQPVPPLAIAEARNFAFDAYLQTKTSIDVPERFLVDSDMLPIEVKSKPENRDGVASIVACLGPFFIGGDVEEGDAKGDDE